MSEMMGLKTPIISILIGEGGSGGALGLAVADEVWMLENAIYSVISPEGCASILWRDSKRAPDAAECLRLTAHDAYEFGVTEKVISEEGEDFERIFAVIKENLYEYFSSCGSDMEAIVNRRYDRFRRIGTDLCAEPKGEQ